MHQKSENHSASASLELLLDELKNVIETLEDFDYSEVISTIFTGSIGAHVRHILDHITIFLESIQDGVCIKYHERRRDVLIETSRIDAIEEIGRIQKLLNQASFDEIHEVSIEDMISPHGEITLRSTAGRELVYLINHALHHNAIISGIMKENGFSVPEYFGYAPSTVAFLEKSQTV